MSLGPVSRLRKKLCWVWYVDIHLELASLATRLLNGRLPRDRRVRKAEIGLWRLEPE